MAAHSAKTHYKDRGGAAYLYFSPSLPLLLCLYSRHGLYVVFDVDFVICLRYLSVIFVPLLSVYPSVHINA